MNNLLFTLTLLLFTTLTYNSHAQESARSKEEVLTSINEIVTSIDNAVDTIYNIDQINSILSGKSGKLGNLIAYYEDLGGNKEKCLELKNTHADLTKRLNDRKEGLNSGNFLNLRLQEEVESKIPELQEDLKTATVDNISTISREYRSLRIKFDVWMENNTVMEDWKIATQERLDALNQQIKSKEKELNN